MSAKKVWVIEMRQVGPDGKPRYQGQGKFVDDIYQAMHFPTRRAARRVIKVGNPLHAKQQRAAQYILGGGKVTIWTRIKSLFEGMKR